MFISEDSNCYQLDINMENFIVIDEIDKLIKFQYEYGIKEGYFKNYINWAKVKEKYDGIFFDNYQKIKLECNKHNKLHELIWFYAIDVSSGCIFNVECIKCLAKL